ncbi:hypothetical protein ADK70_26950 [Streptomyces rimosus subsp. pseudoverticillatus]|uniref:hypothetical protein n=1 Tax=Streptomyces rimosus TaxID=1927 RepID=UPI0006B28590|nr:hypothetical protein [Streptomyces rimosus]KOT80898.1 hypothetical protein ADK70_26950 [Streptomyces rimosus subsp. pseudoverticillatus]
MRRAPFGQEELRGDPVESLPYLRLPGFAYRRRLVLHTDADEAVEAARRLLASREKAAQEKRRVLEGR